MGMQVIPTFKSMDLKTPMLQQQMVLKRNQDMIDNMLKSWEINKGFKVGYQVNPKTGQWELDPAGQNLQVIQDIIGEIGGRKNATPFGMGWINMMPQKVTK